ncbi:MAG: MFS transporter [Rhizobiaceae bacterium]
MIGIAVLAATYILSQFYRTFLAVLTPALQADIGATKTDLSVASGAWFITFALMQFVVGVCLDRFGPRRTASVILALFGAGGAVLFALAGAPWMIVIAMAMIGIGCSPVLMASYYIIAKTYSPARFAVLASWIIAIGMIGNVIGSSPMANAAEAFGWRAVMLAFAAATLLAAIVLYLAIRDPEPEEHDHGADSGFSGYVELAKMTRLWPVLPMMTVCYVAAAGIRGLWAGPYVADVYDADALTIGTVTFYMALAMVAGSLVYGPLDALFGTRKWVNVWGNVICVAACAWLAFDPQSTILAATAALVVIGLSGSSFAVVMAHGRAFIPQHMTGRGVTLMNFFGIGGVGLMQVATGGVVAVSADPAAPQTAYAALFGFYAIVIAAALAIYLLSRDMKP